MRPANEVYREWLTPEENPWTGWQVLGRLYNDKGYDWQTVAVLMAPDGELWTYSDSGCSCNSEGGEGPPWGLRRFEWAELEPLALEGADDEWTDGYWNAADVTQFLAAVAAELRELGR